MLLLARVYLAAAKVHWPKLTLDVQADFQEIEAALVEVQRKHPADVRFVGGEILHGDEEVRPWLAKMADLDGVLIIPLTQPLPALGALVNALNVPTLFFSRPYATHAWSGIGAMRKAGKKIDVVASTSYGDLDPYLHAFRTVHHLRKSKVLVSRRWVAGCKRSRRGSMRIPPATSMAQPVSLMSV